MPKKRFGAEQIVTLLRQIEVSMAQGKATPVACRDAGISQQSYYRWRKEYGGLEIDQAKRMKDLERENVRLKRLLVRRLAIASRNITSEVTRHTSPFGVVMMRTITALRPWRDAMLRSSSDRQVASLSGSDVSACAATQLRSQPGARCRSNKKRNVRRAHSSALANARPWLALSTMSRRASGA